MDVFVEDIDGDGDRYRICFGLDGTIAWYENDGNAGLLGLQPAYQLVVVNVFTTWTAMAIWISCLLMAVMTRLLGTRMMNGVDVHESDEKTNAQTQVAVFHQSYH